MTSIEPLPVDAFFKAEPYHQGELHSGGSRTVIDWLTATSSFFLNRIPRPKPKWLPLPHAQVLVVDQNQAEIDSDECATCMNIIIQNI